MLAAAVAGVEEDAAGGGARPRKADHRGHRSTIDGDRFFSFASTGTVVSSAWIRAAANTWAPTASTKGIKVAATAPTQSAKVDTSSATPSRV